MQWNASTLVILSSATVLFRLQVVLSFLLFYSVFLYFVYDFNNNNNNMHGITGQKKLMSALQNNNNFVH